MDTIECGAGRAPRGARRPLPSRWLAAVVAWAALAVACGDSAQSNVAPVAEAGAAQTAATGTTVTLDGSGSRDPDGGTLTYAWAISSKPATSVALLSASATAAPTFVPDVAGAYVLTLVVSDGTLFSVPDTVTVTATASNSPPVADAGIDRSVVAGTLVGLDGSASSDFNRDTLRFQWVLTSRPAGSGATLAEATSAKPTLRTDQPGDYVVTLTVNDGLVDSGPDSVTIRAIASPGNVAPVAVVGLPLNIVLGQTVQLDGSASFDVNGDLLTYDWSITTRPAGSTAALTGTGATRQFTPDLAGSYSAQLVVSDGRAVSAPAIVAITVGSGNVAPVALAGPDQTVAAGATVTLDGRDSFDANGDVLRPSWALIARPTGSTASLSSSTVIAPTFVADVAGTYVAALVISDGFLNSAADNVTVTAVAAAPSYDGNWAGVTAQGEPVSFSVASNRIASVSFDWVSPACGVGGSTTFDFTPPLEIKSGVFAFSTTVGDVFRGLEGSFSSATHASGRLGYRVVTPTCTQDINTEFVADKS